MSDKNDDPNLVNLKDWKKQKAQQDREKARAKPKAAGGGGGIDMSSALAKRLALGAFILVILWLAMPKDFVATILQSIGM